MHRLVAVIGRIAPWKGQHVAIAALQSLPDVHLLLVGDALFGETDYVRTIREMAEQPEVRGRVHFTGFQLDLAPLMQLVDVIVHCSVVPEPFGRVIVEAMLSRRPVIASNAGGAAEIVKHEQTGLLTPPGDSDALSSAMTRMLGDRMLAQSCAEAGFTDASKRFRIEDRVAETNAVVSRVAGII